MARDDKRYPPRPLTPDDMRGAVPIGGQREQQGVQPSSLLNEGEVFKLEIRGGRDLDIYMRDGFGVNATGSFMVIEGYVQSGGVVSKLKQFSMLSIGANGTAFLFVTREPEWWDTRDEANLLV